MSGRPAEVERKLSRARYFVDTTVCSQDAIIIFLGGGVGGYAPFSTIALFPTFHDTIITMFDRVKEGTIPLRAWAS